MNTEPTITAGLHLAPNASRQYFLLSIIKRRKLSWFGQDVNKMYCQKPYYKERRKKVSVAEIDNAK